MGCSSRQQMTRIVCLPTPCYMAEVQALTRMQVLPGLGSMLVIALLMGEDRAESCFGVLRKACTTDESLRHQESPVESSID